MKSAAHPVASEVGACDCGNCAEVEGKAVRIADTSNAVESLDAPIVGVGVELKNRAASASGPKGPVCVRKAWILKKQV